MQVRQVIKDYKMDVQVEIHSQDPIWITKYLGTLCNT